MEETLDTNDWNYLQVVGSEIVKDMIVHMEQIRTKSVWQQPSQSVIDFFDKPLPTKPTPLNEVYSDVKTQIIPYTSGNNHPRFWGWVMGNGTPVGMLAEMIAAGLNVNMVGGFQSGSLVEKQVLNWLKELMGYSNESSGVLVSGASMANFIGLSVALNSKANFDIGKEGLQNSKDKFCFYASKETHNSIEKAIKLLGIGTDYLRLIDVNEKFEIDTAKLLSDIHQDKIDGLIPCCIVGNAGTVNTGAIDNLKALAEISEAENIWFHVDGAIAAVLMMNENLKSKLDGIAKADSIAFDLHKWAHIQYEAGCCIIKNSRKHSDTFSIDSDYLEITKRGFSGGDDWFCDYTIELSRGFKALKVWMAFRESGIEKIGRLMEQNIVQAKYLESLLEKESNIELLAPTNLNIVCFRVNVPEVDETALNIINEEIVLRIQEGGKFLSSYTRINGKYSIRVCITNHRSKSEDLFEFVSEVKKIAKQLFSEKNFQF